MKSDDKPTLPSWKWIVTAIIPVMMFLNFYPHYLRNNTFFWVCLLTLPISVQYATQKSGQGVLWFIMAIGAISFLLPTTIGIYLILCLSLFYLLQSYLGQQQYTLIIHALLISPLFGYFSSLISFPMRLELSGIVTFLLETIDISVHLEGNFVQLGDQSFLVDEACAGMYMLGYGLLFGTLILSHFTKFKTQHLRSLTLYYGALFALIMLGNIVRITMLVLFVIRPDHWLHEGIGLMLFVIQVLFPFYKLVEWATRNSTSTKEGFRRSVPIFPLKQYVILCGLMILLTANHHWRMANYNSQTETINWQGYQSKLVKEEVIQLQNDHALIYIKPPVAPYRADHNPMICWQGSGYSFKKIDKWKVNDLEVNHAELEKGEDKIYTAWWFQSKNFKTGDQLEWRKYSLLHGENFFLINVSCSSKEQLKVELQKVLTQTIFSNVQKQTINES